MPGKRLDQLGAGIAAVCEEMTQPGKAKAKRLDHILGCVPVLNVGGVNQDE